MKKYLPVIIALAMLIGSLSGCSQDRVYGKEGTDIAACVGETFTIALEENPTTGYQWSYAIGDAGVVELIKDDFKTASDKNVVGAPGERRLTFKAKAAGSTDITLVYERSWEKNAGDETIVYKVTVK